MPRRFPRGLLGAVLALIIALTAASSSDGQELPGRAVPEEGYEHVAEGTPLTFQHEPPASGTHYPRWARWAFYEAELPVGYWVHNLEHGGIVLLYRCDEECDARVAALRPVYDALPPSRWGHVKALATSYDRMNSAIAVVAWNRIAEMETVDAALITAFYQAFVDQGPEDIP